ncbi:hypothetical protein [Embleya sp. NBC_00896]|uniref:hypothetical protein n=1 Tax=Embleya sp. NBC_00896 TaxID=2975961 RepID=UPI002F90D673|nr:hypothetical protein OG928_35540 [Embleya sp. NBC_00896]
MFDGPVHDATRGYLHAVADGGSTAAFHGACGGARVADARQVLSGEGAGFGFSLVSSTQTDDSATVNVKVTGADGTPSPYSVDLRRENGKWFVCDVGTGNIAIDVNF